MQAKEVIEELTRRFQEAGIETPRIDARLLTAFVLKVDPVCLRMVPEYTVEPDDWEIINSYALRRLKHEPVSKILGSRGFWRLDFKVTPDVLDPRPDSETLIEAVLKAFPDRTAPLKIADLGTGSGCLALSLLAEYRNAEAAGVDISPKALDIAKENAVSNGLSARFTPVLADWNQERWVEKLHAPFDIVISNPPYIGEKEKNALSLEVLHYDPAEALFSGTDGLDSYKRLAGFLPDLMKNNGFAVFEFGIGQHEEVKKILCGNEISFASFEKDLNDIVRCISVIHRKTT